MKSLPQVKPTPHRYLKVGKFLLRRDVLRQDRHMSGAYWLPRNDGIIRTCAPFAENASYPRRRLNDRSPAFLLWVDICTSSERSRSFGRFFGKLAANGRARRSETPLLRSPPWPEFSRVDAAGLVQIGSFVSNGLFFGLGARNRDGRFGSCDAGTTSGDVRVVGVRPGVGSACPRLKNPLCCQNRKSPSPDRLYGGPLIG